MPIDDISLNGKKPKNAEKHELTMRQRMYNLKYKSALEKHSNNAH
jgi:hypothetical protein